MPLWYHIILCPGIEKQPWQVPKFFKNTVIKCDYEVNLPGGIWFSVLTGSLQNFKPCTALMPIIMATCLSGCNYIDYNSCITCTTLSCMQVQLASSYLLIQWFLPVDRFMAHCPAVVMHSKKPQANIHQLGWSVLLSLAGTGIKCGIWYSQCYWSKALKDANTWHGF